MSATRSTSRRRPGPRWSPTTTCACVWRHRGVQNFDPMNTGGTIDAGGFKVSLVRADHSAGLVEAGVGFPLGSPNGIVVRAAGEPTVYHMGDTDIFGDMALINEIYAPKVGLVPIGDRFTMGAASAALAVQALLPVRDRVPVPLRLVRDHRSQRGEVRGGDGGERHEGARAGERRGVGLTSPQSLPRSRGRGKCSGRVAGPFSLDGEKVAERSEVGRGDGVWLSASPGQPREDRFEHDVHRQQRLVVPEAQDAVALPGKLLIPDLVAAASSGMLRAVQLDDQLRFPGSRNQPRRGPSVPWRTNLKPAMRRSRTAYQSLRSASVISRLSRRAWPICVVECPRTPRWFAGATGCGNELRRLDRLRLLIPSPQPSPRCGERGGQLRLGKRRGIEPRCGRARARPLAFQEVRMSVDQATVRRIAHLARIAVTEEEVPHLQGELNAILAFVEQLDEVDVEGVEPMTSVTPMVDEDARGRGHRRRRSRVIVATRRTRGRLLRRAEGGRVMATSSTSTSRTDRSPRRSTGWARKPSPRPS